MSTICLYLDKFNNGSQLSVGSLSKFIFMVKICIVWLMSRCECEWSENSSALEGRSFNNNIGNGPQAWKVTLSAGIHQSLHFSLFEWAHSAASQFVIAHLHQYDHRHRSSRSIWPIMKASIRRDFSKMLTRHATIQSTNPSFRIGLLFNGHLSGFFFLFICPFLILNLLRFICIYGFIYVATTGNVPIFVLYDLTNVKFHQSL